MTLINPKVLEKCKLIYGDQSFSVVDLSQLRIVTVISSELMLPAEPFLVKLRLDEDECTVTVLKGHQSSSGRVRLNIVEIVPSSKSMLRMYLKPGRIGESLWLENSESKILHFHGLNETDLWLDPEGAILFSFLDISEKPMQFVIRVTKKNSFIEMGSVPREDFLSLQDWEAPLPFSGVVDRELISKLMIARDVVTHFRPKTQLEYSVKQRFIRMLGEQLFSRSLRYDGVAKPPVSRNI